VREFLNDDEYSLDEEMLTTLYHVSLLPGSRLYTLISTCPDTIHQEIPAQMTRTLGASQQRTEPETTHNNNNNNNNNNNKNTTTKATSYNRQMLTIKTN